MDFFYKLCYTNSYCSNYLSHIRRNERYLIMRAYERLLKYVSYETTSDESSESCPSSDKELVLANVLVEELKEIGVADAHVDAEGYRAYSTYGYGTRHVGSEYQAKDCK